MPCNIYYYSNNIQLSNLLDCSLRIRGKSRLVKFPVRYESLYLKNCPGRNIPFSVVDTQKRCHFIFHPQQDLMKKKKKNKIILLSFTFYSLRSAALNMKLPKKLDTLIFPDISDFQNNQSFLSTHPFNTMFFNKTTKQLKLFSLQTPHTRPQIFLFIIEQWSGAKWSGFIKFLLHPLLYH